MNNWQKVKLKEIAQIIDSLHRTPKYSNVGVPMVRVTDIREGFLKFDNCLRVSEEVFREYSKKYSPKQNDIVFSRVGSEGISSLVQEGQRFCLGQNTVFIVPNINNRYLYYWLISPQAKSQIKENTTGSTQKTISLESIRNLAVDYPNDHGNNISNLLSSFDDKIELLREQNKTLENIAQALFKRWFVDFEFPDEDGKPYKSSGGKFVENLIGEIPMGWKLGILKDLIGTVVDNRGKTPITTEKASINTYPLVEVNAMVETSRVIDINKVKKNVDTQTYKTWFRAGHPVKKDVLVSTVGSIGLVCQIWEEKICIAQNIIALRSNNGNFLYQLLKTFVGEIEGLNISSVQPSIKVPHLLNLQIILPEANLVERYEIFVESYVAKIHFNNLQVQTLSKLRDTLLPKLMNNEIDVQINTITHI